MTNNYKTARIIMIITIILSTFFGNYRSISTETKKVLQVFEIGENKDGLCARNDIKDRYNDSMNLLSLANRYSIQNESTSTLTQVTQSIFIELGSSSSAKSITNLYKLNNEMSIAFNKAYDILISELSDSDKKLAQGLYDDFHSSANILSHSEYNRYAATYNQMINSFPNNLLSITNQAKVLPLFGE